MYKKTALTLLATTLILSGCGGVKEEFEKGYTLYEKGDIESLLESKEFFTNYKEKNPGDDDVNEYISLVNEAIVTQAKDLTMSSYDEKEIEKAWEYIQIARDINPGDKEIEKAYSTVKVSYDDQMIYNDYADFLEDTYVKMKVVPDTWDTKMKQYQVGLISVNELINTSKSLYLYTVEIRKSIGDKTFELVSENEKVFQNANTYLFDYAINLEQELAELARLSNEEEKLSYIENNLKEITASKYSKTFLDVQNQISQFVTEINFEGEAVRNIKDTLNFNEAVKEQQENLAAQQQNSTNTTPGTNANTNSGASTNTNRGQ